MRSRTETRSMILKWVNQKEQYLARKKDQKSKSDLTCLIKEMKVTFFGTMSNVYGDLQIPQIN